MSRYRAGLVPLDEFDYGDPGETAREIIDARRERWIDTGLVDAGGEPIYRRRQTVPLGFHRQEPR